MGSLTFQALPPPSKCINRLLSRRKSDYYLNRFCRESGSMHVCCLYDCFFFSPSKYVGLNFHSFFNLLLPDGAAEVVRRGVFHSAPGTLPVWILGPAGPRHLQASRVPVPRPSRRSAALEETRSTRNLRSRKYENTA